MKKHNKWRAGVTLALCALAVAATLLLVFGLWRVRQDADAAAPDVPAVADPTPTSAPEPAAAPAVITADDTVPGARGSSIPVTWYRPENVSGTPLVVFCHGFTGDRTVNGHFAPLAQALAERGVASIALDFAGQGERRTESGAAYTLSNCAADIDACIDWMGAQQGVDTQRIALVGHSMGGRIATAYLDLGAHAGAVQALALWSPADGDGLRGLEFLNIENFADVEAWREQARAEGQASIYRWGDFVISDAMFTEMEQSHPAETLAAFAGPILLCYTPEEGSVFTEEYTVQPTIAAVEACAQGIVVDREIFAGGGHNYTTTNYDLSEDDTAAVNADLDAALRAVTLDMLLPALGAG